MLLPAIVVGYTLAGVKLVAFLATAMLIETRWFLRHRLADRHRQLYPIVGHDLTVLRAQAYGDIKGFARRHGIRELVLADNSVTWRGCNKATLPCPFNFYVNRLGPEYGPVLSRTHANAFPLRHLLPLGDESSALAGWGHFAGGSP